MLGNTGNEHLGCGGEVAATIVHLVDAVRVGDREVQVETGATFITPGLAQEGRVLAALGNDVLDRGLEEEGAVCSIECLAVPEVHFVLGWAELVVTGESTNVEVIQHAHEVQEVTVRINQGSRHIDATSLGKRAGEVSFVIAVGNVELELGANNGVQT